MIREYGLIGYPLEHTFSKKYFTEKFRRVKLRDVRYHLYPISDMKRFNSVIDAHPHLYGLNVTTPYKQLVIPYLNDLDSLAFTVGAVNTICIRRDGDHSFLKGYNTDIYGILKMLEGLELPKSALILGTGGASRAVRYVLRNKNIDTICVSREPSKEQQIAYTDLKRNVIPKHLLIVNTTPVGMYPDVKKCPAIPYDQITDKHICLDLVYKPAETLFMKKAAAQGAHTANGTEMLYEQAEKAWELWEESFRTYYGTGKE